MPVSKAHITDGFQEFLRRIRQTVQYRSWLSHPEYRPDQKLVEEEELARANEEIGQSFGRVVNAEDPGTMGDMILFALQGDLLASARRALVSRRMTPVDCRLAAVCRLRGHVADTGLWSHGIPSYLQAIDKISKQAKK